MYHRLAAFLSIAILLLPPTQFGRGVVVRGHSPPDPVTATDLVENTTIYARKLELINFSTPPERLVAAGQVYLPLVQHNEVVCGQFVWFKLGIDRYPGFQLYSGGEIWFFDEFSLGTMPAEGTYGLIINPRFMNEDFTPGIRWLSGASAVTPVAGCGV